MSVQDDIVAMIANKAKSKALSKRKRNEDDENKDEGKPSLPPWIKHFQSVKDGVKTVYKVGDTKTWKGETWYFCDCPNHRDRVKWHTHPAETCRTRKRWLANKKAKITANEGIVDEDSKEQANDNEDEKQSNKEDLPVESDPVTVPADVTTLLANALNLLSDNPVARDLVADAINETS